MHTRKVISPNSHVCINCIHCIHIREFSTRIEVKCELDYNQDILKECPHFKDVASL